MFKGKKIIIILFLSILFVNSVAQHPAGIARPYLEVFQDKCAGLEKSQIWSVTPGDGDYIFFASNNGLGIYDGVRWEVSMPKGGLIMRSLYYDTKSSTLYSGSVNQFGKWHKNKYGKFEYTPIWSNITKNKSIEFWRIASTGNNKSILYAQSHQMILKYDIETQHLDSILTEDNFSYMHAVAGDIWVQIQDSLFRVGTDNTLQKILEVNDRVIHLTRRSSDNKILLFLEYKGIFVLSDDYTKITSINIGTNIQLSKAKMFTVKENDKGQYLVGTTNNGLYILDENANIIDHVNEERGLPTSSVLSVSTDNSKNVWMGFNSGVAVLDIGSGETYLSPKPSIGFTRSILPFKNDLYIGTNQGIFKRSGNGNFTKIENTSGSIWAMYNIENSVVYSHDLGLFRLEGDIPVKIKSGGTTALAKSLTSPSYYVGTDYYGLSLYKLNDSKLSYVSKIKGFDGASRDIIFDRYGYLWLMIPKDGFIRLTLSEDMASVEEIKQYKMPSSDNTDYFLMTQIDNHIVYYDGQTTYSYNARTQEMVKNEILLSLFQKCGKNLVSLNQFDNTFWYQTPTDIGYIQRKGDKLEKHSGAFAKIYNKRIYPLVTKLDLETYAIGYMGGIALSKLGNEKKRHLKIRSVEAYGVGEPVYYDLDQKRFELSYNKKILNIYPINLDADHVIEYRILEIDSAWISEKIDNCLTITSLESGTYTIQIRNSNDKDLEPEGILVKIAMPWYFSGIMIGVYTIIAGIIILIIFFVHKRKIQKEKRRVERIKQAEVDKLERENLKQSQFILELEKDKLEIALKEKDKRLAFITMNGVKRNNLMTELKQDVQETEQYELGKEVKKIIKQVIKKIEGALESDEDWEIFEKYFNIVFDGFLERLAIKYPQLSHGDLKLLAYLKLNLSNKEIANLLNISYRSVEMAKYRLRKKLNLEANDNFTTILNEKS